MMWITPTKLMGAVVVSLVMLVAVACAPPTERVQGLKVAPEVGALAPNFTLTSLQGKTVRLSSLRGKPVVINFFASWCIPCRLEAPHLQNAHDQFAKDGLVMIGVDSGEGQPQVEKFVKNNSWTFEILLDPDESMGRSYQIFGLPSTFFIDKDGVVRAIKIGAFVTMEDLQNNLDKIMKKS